MKLIRFKEVQKDGRPDGRIVRKLISHHFNKPVKSMAFYLCEVPGGKFGEHHHSEAEELIMFPNGGRITVNGKDIDMEDWDFVILAPGDKHGFSGECGNIIHLAMKFPDAEDKISD
jgi:quercetin dioxygenase-like cupin family protein